MEFGLSEEQALLQHTINDYLDTNVPLKRVRVFAEERDGKEIWQGLVELGVAGLLIPENQGGAGLGVLDAGA